MPDGILEINSRRGRKRKHKEKPLWWECNAPPPVEEATQHGSSASPAESTVSLGGTRWWAQRKRHFRSPLEARITEPRSGVTRERDHRSDQRERTHARWYAPFAKRGKENSSRRRRGVNRHAFQGRHAWATGRQPQTNRGPQLFPPQPSARIDGTRASFPHHLSPEPTTRTTRAHTTTTRRIRSSPEHFFLSFFFFCSRRL